MRYILALAFVGLIGCGEEPAPTTGTAESWAYLWSFDNGEPSINGDMSIYREAGKIRGTVYKPLNYPAGTVWDATLSGDSAAAVSLLNFGNPWWSLACDSEMACEAVQVDSGATGTFLGTRH